MKRDHWIYLILGAVALYLLWPHLRAGYAQAQAWINPDSSAPVITGTADSGADATVLTNTCIGPEGIS